MAKIDPKNSDYDGKGGKTEKCGPGEKLLAAVGYERYESSRNNKMVGVRYLCLVDYAGTGDEGKIAFDDFALTEASLWRIVALARGLGYNEPFDPDDDGDLEKMLYSGYVKATLEERTFKGKTKLEPASYDPMPKGQADDPAWAAMIEAAEEQHREYLDWRETHPRGERRDGGGGGDGARRGGGTKRPDDDIPF